MSYLRGRKHSLKQNYKLVPWLSKHIFTKKPYESSHRVTKKQLSNSKRLRNAILPQKTLPLWKRGVKSSIKLLALARPWYPWSPNKTKKIFFHFMRFNCLRYSTNYIYITTKQWTYSVVSNIKPVNMPLVSRFNPLLCRCLKPKESKHWFTEIKEKNEIAVEACYDSNIVREYLFHSQIWATVNNSVRQHKENLQVS